MTRRLVLLLSLAVGAIGACTHDLDGTIDYERSGGFGGIRTSVHIDPDGKATRTKRDGSVETTRLDPAVLDDLERKVAQAQFPTLETMYGCGGCADDFVHTISVHIDGSSHTVKTDDSASYPERLRPLIDALSTMVEEALDGTANVR